jgi:hypothetical protein
MALLAKAFSGHAAYGAQARFRDFQHGGGQVSSPIRHPVTLRAVTLAIGVATGATLLVLAQGEPQAAPDLRATAGSEAPDEAPFLAENGAAMTKMMNDMAVKPVGDVDRDFVAMMVPHHQGAINMALAVLRYGHNAQIKRLAQEIIVTQQQEIAAMRLAVGEPLPPSMPSPTQPAPTAPLDPQSMSHDTMSPGMKMK